MVVVLQDYAESSYSRGIYDEVIILEGPNVDLSRISQIVKTVTNENAPCMRVKHEISSFDSTGEDILEDHSRSK